MYLLHTVINLKDQLVNFNCIFTALNSVENKFYNQQ